MSLFCCKTPNGEARDGNFFGESRATSPILATGTECLERLLFEADIFCVGLEIPASASGGLSCAGENSILSEDGPVSSVICFLVSVPALSASEPEFEFPISASLVVRKTLRALFSELKLLITSRFCLFKATLLMAQAIDCVHDSMLVMKGGMSERHDVEM